MSTHQLTINATEIFDEVARKLRHGLFLQGKAAQEAAYMLYMYAVVAKAQCLIETLFKSRRCGNDTVTSFNYLVAMLTEIMFYDTYDELTRTPYGQLTEQHVFRKYISSRHCPSATRPVYDLIGADVETVALAATQSFMTELYNQKIYPITLGAKCSTATARRLKGDGLFWNVRFEVKEPNQTL